MDLPSTLRRDGANDGLEVDGTGLGRNGAQKKELVVALVAGDGACAGSLRGEANLAKCAGNTLEAFQPHRGVTHDAALPHLRAVGLELRLDQGEKLPRVT